MFLSTLELKLLAQGVDANNEAGLTPPVQGQVPPLPEADEGAFALPAQATPPGIQPVSDPASIYNLGPDTNLIRLLDDIRDLAKNGELDVAQSLTGRALEKIGRTEQNSFYLRQIRKEETQLYFRRATQAMRDKNYSLASQLLSRYRENVKDDLEERKQKREILLENQGNRDVSLVGKLVEELDKAKKDLAEIRAKAGLPEDDAKPDFRTLDGGREGKDGIRNEKRRTIAGKGEKRRE